MKNSDEFVRGCIANLEAGFNKVIGWMSDGSPAKTVEGSYFCCYICDGGLKIGVRTDTGIRYIRWRMSYDLAVRVYTGLCVL